MKKVRIQLSMKSKLQLYWLMIRYETGIKNKLKMAIKELPNLFRQSKHEVLFG